jgi:hypothetical protein
MKIPGQLSVAINTRYGHIRELKLAPEKSGRFKINNIAEVFTHGSPLYPG